LKAYRTNAFNHIIPLKEDAKPFKHQQRAMNPKLATSLSTLIVDVFSSIIANYLLQSTPTQFNA
jgi:hypothetical protein